MEEYKIKNCLRLSIGNSSENKYLLKVVKKYLKMFNSILIIGCGMIGSSILRGAISRKLPIKFMFLKKISNIIIK